MKPELLIDKEFIIPVYNAEHQKYKCIGVDVEYPGNGRTYKIQFTEIQELGYNVPGRLELVLCIPFTNDIVKIRLNEIKPAGNAYKLNEIDIATKKINSVNGFGAVLKVLAKEI